MNKRKSPTKITPELIQKLQKLVESGKQNKEIAEELNIGITTIRTYKNKYNMKYIKPTVEDFKDQIIEMYTNGISVKDIAKELGYKSETTIKNLLNKYSVECNRDKKYQELKKKLRQIIPTCFSVYEVAKKVGCVPTTVRKYMKEFNLSLNIKYELTDSDVKNIEPPQLKYDFNTDIKDISKEDKKEFIENKIRHIILRTRKYVSLLSLKNYGINPSLLNYYHINVPEINSEFGLTHRYASALEAYFADFCENHNILYESQKTFEGCVYKDRLRFDYYLPEFNILIEIQGKQHYESLTRFGGDDFLKEQTIKDNIKLEWCKSNNKTLYVICYKDLYKKDYLENLLSHILVAKHKSSELLETPEVDNQQPS